MVRLAPHRAAAPSSMRSPRSRSDDASPPACWPPTMTSAAPTVPSANPTRRTAGHREGLRIVAPVTRIEPTWTPREAVIYLASLAPFVLFFVAAAIGWTIAPLEHLRPTPQNIAAGVVTLVIGLIIVRRRWGTRHVLRLRGTVAPEFDSPEDLGPAGPRPVG